MQPPNATEQTWRRIVFKNRGLLLVPVAAVLVVGGSPSPASAAAGVVFAALGEALRIWAVGYSGTTTRADVVTAPRLVTAGPYAMVRNPLYLGNAIIAFGFWLAFSGNVAAPVALAMLAITAAFVVGVYATIIPLEESYLERTFASAYEHYRARVPSIFPSTSARGQGHPHGTWDPSVILKAESISIAYFILMTAAVGLKLKLWAAT